jgi:hypothetical protein
VVGRIDLVLDAAELAELDRVAEEICDTLGEAAQKQVPGIAVPVTNSIARDDPVFQACRLFSPLYCLKWPHSHSYRQSID